MAVNQQQLTTNNGGALKGETIKLVPGQTQTDAPFLLRQVPFGFLVQNASTYCRTYTAILAAKVGFLPVGRALQAVTLQIGTTKSKFKLANALLGISGTKNPVTDMATVVNKAIEDDIEFSSAFTINDDAETGSTFWGACRVQMDATGAVSTRVVAADQAFLSEADALRNVPDAAANMIDLGTISFEVKSGQTFTAGTTELDNSTVLNDVNYNGAASGFVNCFSDTDGIDFVAATLTEGTPEEEVTDRVCQHPGGMLVGLYTSDGSMVVTDAIVNVLWRPYPMNNEAAFQE